MPTGDYEPNWFGEVVVAKAKIEQLEAENARLREYYAWAIQELEGVYVSEFNRLPYELAERIRKNSEALSGDSATTGG